MTEEYRLLQEKDIALKRIGWLGPKGTFTEKAAKMWQIRIGELTANLTIDYSPNIATIFRNIFNGSLDMGIVPIENTTGGPVKETHVEFEKMNDMTIVGEIVLPIRQYFYCQNSQSVRAIASKDQGLAQTKTWREKNYPSASKLEVDSTSRAVQMAAEDFTIGAIAGADAADELGLSAKLKRTDKSVEDNKANITTFVAITKNSEVSDPTGNDKTTAIMELANHAGSLYSVLADLAQRGINLTKIKSLKSTDGKIRFLISLDGHQKEEKIKSALSTLASNKVELKLLGSYLKDSYVQKEKNEPNMENAIRMIEKEVENGKVNDERNAVVVFNLLNQVGSLANILKIFADQDINLTKIDSMPSGNFEEYIFYLSFNLNDVRNQHELFRELTSRCKNMTRLR